MRQLRLRDIGGIIVIDFIDMANPKNRATVEEALRTELERDRTKTYVVEISPLGLVEMTRQNVTDGPREILTDKLPDLRGRRHRRLRGHRRARDRAQAARARGRARACRRSRSRCTRASLALLVGPGGARLAAIEAASRRRFFLVPRRERHVHLDHFESLAQGKLDDARSPAAPVAEGSRARAEARRGRPPRPDGRRRQARRLRGRRRRRREARRQEGRRRASAACSTAPPTRRSLSRRRRGAAPITFEAEAEKPTRASRSKKDGRAPRTSRRARDGGRRASRRRSRTSRAEVDGGRASTARTAKPRPAADGGAEEEADAPRHARRPQPQEAGRRGAADGAHEQPARPANGRPQRPRIHVPPADLGDVPARRAAAEAARRAEARRRRRRPGAGGCGRGRTSRRSAEAQALAPRLARRHEAAEAGRRRRRCGSRLPDGRDGEPARSRAADGSRRDDEAPAYVPMSEWIDDFDARSRGVAAIMRRFCGPLVPAFRPPTKP